MYLDDQSAGLPDHPKTSANFRAAEYVRMSTEHQQYSTENQGDKIREYAERRGIEIVRTYADAGKSGLRIAGRQALQQLIKDVETGVADFQIILVYDVSRWGRFQDADESAYYEYICRRAGIQVAYCAEQFENDGSPVSTIVKGVKRAMAGEYSRELSAKVFAGQCRLIELGFRQGGPAGFGLRRILIDQAGSIKSELSRGEHKSLQTDRVILQPGPDTEVAVVNQIYRWFVDDNLVESEIAEQLNGQGIKTDLGREWTRATVREILSNEKYIGNNVYNRRSFKLKKLRVVNSPDMWIKKEGAFEGIVPAELFYTTQGILRARAHRYSEEELIEKLRNLYQRHGYTYNNRVNRLSSIQEHVMIRRAVERGVAPQRLAKALDVDISHIMKKLNLLDGICPEAAEFLRDQVFSANLGAVLRKMKPTRQVECVELMVSANNLTIAYAQALLAATPSNMIVGESKTRKMTGVSADQMAKMEKEMGNLQEQFKLAEQSYGQDVLNLVLARGYLAKLMGNDSILRHLKKRHTDVLSEFDAIVNMAALDK